MGVKWIRWALILFAAMVAQAPARADDPVQTYADRWLDARDGEETFSQWASRQLNTGIVDRIVKPGADGTKGEIAKQAVAAIGGLRDSHNSGRQRLPPCVFAAVDQAHTLSLSLGRRDIMNGAAQMLFGGVTGAAGGAGGAGNLVGLFGREMADKILDGVREKALERATADVQQYFRDKGVITDAHDDTRGKCTSQYRMVWNLAQQSYEFIIVGDCQCERVTPGVNLARWSIRGSGSVVPSLHHNDREGLTVRFAVGRPTVQVTASCCDAQGRRSYTRHPNQGDSSCDFVNVTWRNETVGPQGAPIIIPRRGDNPPPPPPPPAGGDLLTMPEDRFSQIYERANEEEERTGRARVAAITKLAEATKKSQGEETPEVTAAQEELERAQQEYDRAQARVRELMDAAAKRIEKETTPQQQQQQQEMLPDDPMGSYESDARRAARRQAIGQILDAPATGSGTDVMVAWPPGEADPSGQARIDAARAMRDAEREAHRRHGTGNSDEQPVSNPLPDGPANAMEPVGQPSSPSPPSEAAQTGSAGDAQPGNPATAVAVPPPAEVAPAEQPPAQAGIAGVWVLEDTSSGVSRVTISQQGNALVLSGMGSDIQLESSGNAYFGEGAVLFGKGGHQIRLVLQGSSLAFEARNEAGGSFATRMRRQ